ncbi:peptide-methionine (S)-S-oxide reductase [Malassezia restricta]|uniref:peptide-methionine (S)-S-oxide reductase n=1 Tax=Malassezia restricta TaxID=76775 RepID=UPI000DD0FF17|nr:peptide-methionine (S)-S-oxide reductase [Malassezia restricta]AXA49345.1 peptide-methionine (S)-S-oxide reductase [Malassezia restricta]
MSTATSEVATFANGCFWGTEHMFRKHYGGKGLIDAKVGFIGGTKADPTYMEVCSGQTGHAEASQLTFEPSKVSYEELVEFFYRTHDPTQQDGQGPDIGSQYRSALFPHTPEQEAIARKVTEEVQKKHFDPHGTRIVTTIHRVPASDFFVAEQYHQEYLLNNPSGYHCPTHRLWW